MKDPIVIIGIGEMGGVFARGFLKIGHPVFPVNRSMDIHTVSREMSPPLLVIVAVAENDLQGVLETLPEAWRDRIVLLQNELLPRDWKPHRLSNPTIMSAWFEKKKVQDVKVVVPSTVFGPGAKLVRDALANVDIPSVELRDEHALLFELVRKNLYILTTNICGLKTGGTVGNLWQHHEDFAREVGSEILDIQEWLVGKTLDREKLTDAMVVAFDADPQHKCMGRSAPARLARALQLADQAGLAAGRLHALHAALR